MSLANFYDTQSDKDHYRLRSRPTLINRSGLKSLVAFDDRFLIVTKLLRRIVKPNDKVLDFGCGDGVYESLLPKKLLKSAMFYGVDISQEQLKKAKDLFFKSSLISDLDPKTNYPDNFFDVVICSEVLEHVFFPETIIAEISRVLKRKGLLILTVPNYGSLQIRLSSLFTGRSPMVSFTYNKEHIRFYSEKDIRYLTSKHFNVSQIKGIGSLLFAKWNFPVYIPVPRLLQLFSNRLFPRLANGLLFVLEK